MPRLTMESVAASSEADADASTSTSAPAAPESSTPAPSSSATPLKTPVSALKKQHSNTSSASPSKRSVRIAETPSRSQSPAQDDSSPLRRSGRARKKIRYDVDVLDVGDDQEHTAAAAADVGDDEDEADTYADGDQNHDDEDDDGPSDIDDEDDVVIETRTPSKRTGRASKPTTPLSSGKRKYTKRVKPSSDDEDDEDDDDKAESHGKLKIFSHTGTNAEFRARNIAGASNKQRAYSYLQIWPLYLPPDLQTLEHGVPVAADNNDDEPDQGDEGDERAGLSWPQDGLPRTRLQASVSRAHRVKRVRYWTIVVGHVPALLLHDMAWWPGKAYGYKAERERGAWAAEARRTGGEVGGSDGGIGWPFVHPRIDVTNVKLLTDNEAGAYQPGARTASTAQRSPLRHPIHVNGAAAPRKKPAPAAGKRKKGAATRAADRDDDDDGESDEDAAEDDAEAERQANKVDVDLEDPKFRDLPNMGLEEVEQDPTESLSVYLGPHDQQQMVEIPARSATRLGKYLDGNEGHILNAGGHVYALDWVPVPIHLNRGKEYVAISAALSPRPTTLLGAKEARPIPGCIQIWSVSPDTTLDDESVKKGEARLEMQICNDSGTAFSLAWCPAGHDYREPQSTTDDIDTGGGASLRRLGLLAGVFEDGSASIFAPPHPDDVRRQQAEGKARSTGKGKGKAKAKDGDDDDDDDAIVSIKLDPIMRLELKSTSITALHWAGGEQLAVGCANGYIATFAVGESLRSGNFADAPLRPTYYQASHYGAVNSLAHHLVPAVSARGEVETSSLPHLIFSVSLDGNLTLTDTQDGSTAVSEHQRHVHACAEFSPFLQAFLCEVSEGPASIYSMRPDEVGRTKGVASTLGRVTCIANSAFHPVVAVGSGAGEVKLSNSLRASRRSGSQKGHSIRSQTPLYRLVTDRKTGALSMLDNWLVESLPTEKETKILAASPSVRITAARWNPNIGRSLFLATATACGLVRLDWAQNRLKIDGDAVPLPQKRGRGKAKAKTKTSSSP